MLRISQLEDPGKYVQVGFSAGARSVPAFHWVRNLLSKQFGADEVASLDRETAHGFSLAWMLFRKKLPNHIIDDIDLWLTQTGITRMNREILNSKTSDIGAINLDVGDNFFTLHGAEGAPPSGGMAANYSRSGLQFI